MSVRIVRRWRPGRADHGVLTDREILRAMAQRELYVSPFDRFDQAALRPAALSLHLGLRAQVLVPRGAVDIADAGTHPELVIREPDARGCLALWPGEVMLAPTRERIALSGRLAGLVDGTSDYARLGISVVLSHQVSPGYGSDIPGGAILTLEIVSRLSEVVYLRPGTRIGNLMLLHCRTAQRAYPLMAANYSRDVDVRASRLAEHSARL